jgi:hypothetical protein
MLNIIILNVAMLNVTMLNVSVLTVMAPPKLLINKTNETKKDTRRNGQAPKSQLAKKSTR